MTTGRWIIALMAVMLVLGWLMRDELRRRLSPPEQTRERVYTWTDRQGNVHYGDRAGSPQGQTVVVDTSRISRLEPLPPNAGKESAVMSEVSGPAGIDAHGRPIAGQAKGGHEELYLQKLGREMQEAQMRVRERQMEQVLEGEPPPSR